MFEARADFFNLFHLLERYRFRPGNFFAGHDTALKSSKIFPAYSTRKVRGHTASFCHGVLNRYSPKRLTTRHARHRIFSTPINFAEILTSAREQSNMSQPGSITRLIGDVKARD